ncbi:SprT-like domain-containing protein, partial [Tenacibaculum ovolyticum]
DGCKGGNYPYYSFETKEECIENCKWDNYTDNTGGNNTGNNSGGGGGSTGNNSNNDNNTNVATTPVNPDGTKVYQIINKLTGKAKCVYDKLLSTGVANFHNMIIDLFIEFGTNNIGNRDLTFKMSDNLPNDVGGKTKVDSDGNYHILINKNLMNTLSSIEVASILVHEMAHAFLGKHYNDSNASFSELYKKYINDTGIQNYSHDIMQDQFINRMATVIRNYDNNIFSSFEDYKTLVSRGVFELSSTQKQNLINVINKARQNDKNCP